MNAYEKNDVGKKDICPRKNASENTKVLAQKFLLYFFWFHNQLKKLNDDHIYI